MNILANITGLIGLGVLVGGLACVAGTEGKTAVTEEKNMNQPPRQCQNPFVPAWKQGDTWRVEYQFMEPSDGNDPGPLQVTEVWVYSVEDEGDADSAFYMLKVHREGSTQRYFRLLIRKTSFTLHSYSHITPGSSTGSVTENPSGVGPYVRFSNYEDSIFDFGSFCDSVVDQTNAVVLGSIPVEQKLVFDGSGKEMKVVLVGKKRNKMYTSEQTWVVGKPWWVNAVKRIGDQTIVAGRLK